MSMIWWKQASLGLGQVDTGKNMEEDGEGEGGTTMCKEGGGD